MKKKEKKKIKIISEKINSQFKESSSIKFAESLESEVQTDNDLSSFSSDFSSSSSERTAPVLQASDMPDVRVLQTTEDISGERKTRNQPEVYNMPDYGRTYETERKRENIIDKRSPDFNPTEFSIKPTAPVQTQSVWQSPEDSWDNPQKYHETMISREDEERAQPMGRRREKRERILN